MCDAVFHLNFLDVRVILAQKICDTIFRQFSDVKNRGRFQQSSVLGQLISGEPQRSRISRPKES